MKELFTALSKFQGECPIIEKGTKGAWGKYADLAAIITTIKPFLAKHGLAIIQVMESDESSTYLKTMVTHDSGEFIESRVKIEYRADNVQKMGANITYYRRYALSSMLGIATDEDVDDVAKADDKDHPYKKNEKKMISDAQLIVINNLIAKSGVTGIRDKIQESCAVKSVNDLTLEQASSVIKYLNQTIDKQEKKNAA